MTGITRVKYISTLTVFLVGFSAQETQAAVAKVGYVNISGTAVNGGQAITIELKNAAGAVVGNATYTTAAGDKEQKISDALKNDFNPTPGYGAKKVKDKADGTEVIKFWRKKQNGQDFEISITVVPGPSEITINAKGTYSNVRTCSVTPTNGGIAASTAAVSLVGSGTEWMSGAFTVTALHFADDITVDSFTIMSDTLINANISWSSGSTLQGGEHVDVLGDDVDDDGASLVDIVHDVSTDPFVLEAGPPIVCENGNNAGQLCFSDADCPGSTCSVPIPAVSEWGLAAMTLLVLTAATVVLLRRRAGMEEGNLSA